MSNPITNPRHLPSSDTDRPQPPHNAKQSGSTSAAGTPLPGFSTIGQAAFRALKAANIKRKKTPGEQS